MGRLSAAVLVALAASAASAQAQALPPRAQARADAAFARGQALSLQGFPMRGQELLAQGIPDDPDLLGTCIMVTPFDGTLTIGGDLKSWATSAPATVTVVNTGTARLFVSKPTQWAQAPSNTPTTNFVHSASLTGVNVGALLGLGDGVSALLSALGASVLSVSVGANAAAPFPAGSYSAQVTVTCAVE